MIKFSLEVFPSKTKGAYYSLKQAINIFSRLDPDFLSVTCGAGGRRTKNLTKDLVIQLSKEYSFPIAAHMTCIGSNRDTITEIADHYWHSGIQHIIALRGDPEKTRKNQIITKAYHHAVDLVKALKSQHDFDISVAAYPEVHPESPSADLDLDYLKQKIDAGANRAITQFFFNPEIFLHFRDQAIKSGIKAPIIPGIIPILDFKKIKTFSEYCGTNIPDTLHSMFDQVKKGTLDHHLLAMNILNNQITHLIREGIDRFHFYTLNETVLIKHICIWLRENF